MFMTQFMVSFPHIYHVLTGVSRSSLVLATSLIAALTGSGSVLTHSGAVVLLIVVWSAVIYDFDWHPLLIQLSYFLHIVIIFSHLHNLQSKGSRDPRETFENAAILLSGAHNLAGWEYMHRQDGGCLDKSTSIAMWYTNRLISWQACACYTVSLSHGKHAKVAEAWSQYIEVN